MLQIYRTVIINMVMIIIHKHTIKTYEEVWHIIPFLTKCKVKVKVNLVQALRLCTGRTAYRESRGIALLFHDHGTRRGEGSASRPGRSLPPGKIQYSLYRRLGGPQGRSGQVRKISPPPGFDLDFYHLKFYLFVIKCYFYNYVYNIWLWHLIKPQTICTICYVYVFLLLCLCIYNVKFLYSYCYVYVFLLLCLCILIVMFMYFYCYVYVFLSLCLCILIVMFMYFYGYVYVFLLLYVCVLIVMFMYSYFYVYIFICLCILIVMFTYSYFYVYIFLCLCILIVMFMYSYCYVYIFLLLCLCIFIVTSMYSYCYVYVFLLSCFMYSYCYVYVLLLLFIICSVYSLFILPTGTLRFPDWGFSVLFPQL